MRIWYDEMEATMFPDEPKPTPLGANPAHFTRRATKPPLAKMKMKRMKNRKARTQSRKGNR